MRVAVNCAIALRGTSGSARGLAHINESLQRLPGVEVLEAWPTFRLRGSRLWNAGVQAHWDLYAAARSGPRTDVLISPCNIGAGLRGQRHVVVVHDTMVLDRPDLFDTGYAAYARVLFGLSAKHADAVMCPSAYTASCLQAHWPSLQNIVVAHWPISPAAVLATPGDHFVVAVVGATEPHKRQVDAIAAVAEVRARAGRDVKLKVIGPPGRAEEDVARAMAAADPEGTWASRLQGLSDEELNAALSTSSVLLQPSVFEGYGLPVAEAAAHGLPTLHSGAGALGEIVPSGIAKTADVEGYVEGILELLDVRRWRERADAGLVDARALSADGFDAALARALGR